MGNSKRAKQQRRAQRAIAGSMTFWHGGVAGRAVGDLLLSPNLTHDPKSVSTLGIREARADRVYFTTDRELARVYASYVQRSRPSALYRVTPIGDLESDPDYPTAGYQSVKARVLEVAELNVVLTRLECAQRCQPYETHVGGGLIHDVDGRMLLSKGMGEAGFTQADLDAEIPRWTALEDAAELLSDLSLRRRAKALSAQLWATRVASPTNVVSEL